jgi:hypothetical protein
MDFNQVIDIVPACPLCFEAMTRCNSLLSRMDRTIDNNAWAKRECSVCSNWMYDLTHPLLAFQRSEYFPKDYELGGEKGTGPLCLVLLTYLILTKVIQISFEMVSSGKWKIGKGLAFLTDNCINQKFAWVHMTCATNRYNLLRAMNNEGDTRKGDIIIADNQQNPNRYTALPVPSLYPRGVPLHAFTDTPMHLIPLGVGKAVFFRIMTWSARRGRKKAFVTIAQSLMEELNILKLPWLTLLPNSIKDKWGG